jgi:hypothetical protein
MKRSRFSEEHYWDLKGSGGRESDQSGLRGA